VALIQAVRLNDRDSIFLITIVSISVLMNTLPDMRSSTQLCLEPRVKRDRTFAPGNVSKLTVSCIYNYLLLTLIKSFV